MKTLGGFYPLMGLLGAAYFARGVVGYNLLLESIHERYHTVISPIILTFEVCGVYIASLYFRYSESKDWRWLNGPASMIGLTCCAYLAFTMKESPQLLQSKRQNKILNYKAITTPFMLKELLIMSILWTVS